ncbi:MAG TPA: response regulator [Vicinamibacterales bacterium]|jgi:DNA-binding NtrC family response regulator
MSHAVSKRLLVVDDDLSLLEALERGLSDGGLDVVAHTTFEGARNALRDERFNALLTDVRLGAFNGIQLAVVARDTYPDMRIIVFSGFDDPVLRSEAQHIGATYLVKPVTASDLIRLLSKA